MNQNEKLENTLHWGILNQQAIISVRADLFNRKNIGVDTERRAEV